MMKQLVLKLIYLFFLFAISISCLSDKKGYEFSNFQNTILNEFSKIVSKDDCEEIKKTFLNNKIDINYKEPIFNQNLLALTIANNKRKAFLTLLELGCDPNLIIGNANDSSPLSVAIKLQKNNDMFFIENLLKYGANPNLCIIPTDNKYFNEFYPLFVAIGKGINNDSNLDVIRILVKYGADVNLCSPLAIGFKNCEGVIHLCIKYNCINFLRYFIIEAKTNIPEVIYLEEGFDQVDQKRYSLEDILNSEDFEFEEFPKEKKIKDEILVYLKKRRNGNDTR